MISSFFLINAKGDVVIYRIYRDDVTRGAADHFRLRVIAAKETGSRPPILIVDRTSFVYVRHGEMYLVAGTRTNASAGMVIHFLHYMVEIFKAYFGEDFTEDSIRDNFTLVYELLDEVCDNGYPQNTAVDVLKMYINLGSVNVESKEESSKLTEAITGTIDWRPEGLRYRKNEVYIDVLESVNLLMSATGTVLRADVTGAVLMRTALTGMPECKFGLNDKLLMDRESASGKRSRRKLPGIEIDDVTFHRCVRLKKFGSDRTIAFTPPDGTFELMKYRVTQNVNLPFRIITALEEEGQTGMSITVKAVGNFSTKLNATHATITVPVPPNTARCKVSTSSGRGKFVAEKRAIVWKCRRFAGGSEARLTARLQLMRSTSGKAWQKPPITVAFEVPMFTASGLVVRFLKVFERMENYHTTKWVRYITKAGQYQIRV